MDLSKYYAKPDKSIKEHSNELINNLEKLNKLGYILFQHTYELTRKACILHDIGKINREFQKRVKNNKLKFDQDKEVSHNILSLYFINQNDFETKEDYAVVAHAVAHHHNYCDIFSTIRNKKDLIEELLNEFEHYQLMRSTQGLIVNMIDNHEGILVEGYLMKCDYSASGEYEIEYPNDFLENALESLMIEWKKNGATDGWNELQNFCYKSQNDNIIAIAQTGMGKTEAALRWIGNHKGFFVLPIRTAINSIFDRIAFNMLHEEKIDTRVALLHSESLQYYSKNIEDEMIDLIEYQKRGRNLSLPLSISTMDQLFDFIYKYSGYEMKLATFSYSKIVIDEIQMYGPDILAYLIFGLKKIHEFGGKIAIVTATLAPFVRELLKPINFKVGEFIDEKARHNVNVIEEEINEIEILKKYLINKNKNKANKILVICNTIRKAQEIYNEIIVKLDNVDKTEVHVLHSYFIKKDRSELEKNIIEFGKTYNKDNKIDIQNGIWITTSLVEASLDIDFDYLFTELQDFNSLLQRLGRCNRKGVKSIKDHNCFVYTVIEPKLIKHGKVGMIDEKIHDLSIEAVKQMKGIVTEKQKIDLINQFFTMDKVRDSTFYKEYYEIYTLLENIPTYEYEKSKIDLRKIRSETVIPSPIYNKYKEKIDEYLFKLKNKQLSAVEKVTYIDRILEFTISIPQYFIENYNRALCNGQAYRYTEVSISSHQKIKVIECEYDNVLGYRELDFKNLVRPTEFL